MIDHESAAIAIRNSPLADRADPLLALLRPSIRVGVLLVSPDDLPLGASRFGGLPDLPAATPWPRGANQSLAFAAQLRMSDLAARDTQHLLPASGWLYFFIDAADEAPFEARGEQPPAWRVWHFDGELGQLQRTSPPAGHDSRNAFAPAALGFAHELTLPSYGAVLLDELALDPALRDAYEDIVFGLHAPSPLPAGHAVGPVRRLLGKLQHRWIGDPIHRVLGHGEHFQLDPRVDWQRLAQHLPLMGPPDVELRAAARDWQLLLQLDAYEGGPCWLWGDNGTMYFGLKTADLAARRFDQVQWTVECG